MEDQQNPVHTQRNREFVASVFSGWAEAIGARLETDERFLRAVEALWLTGLDDLINEEDAAWHVVLAVLATLKAERQNGVM